MKITIAIPTYCRPDSVARLLRSLSEQVRMPDEVLVVDSSPDTKTAAVVESFSAASGFTVRYMQHEKGLTRQRNRAIRESSGDVVVFFDDDLVLEPDFLKEIERAFQEHGDVAGIGGFIVNEWGKRIDRFWKVRRLLGLLPGSYREGRVLPYGVALPLSTLQTFSGIKAVDWLPGCAFALRREVFLRHQFSTFFEGYGLAEDKQVGPFGFEDTLASTVGYRAAF